MRVDTRSTHARSPSLDARHPTLVPVPRRFDRRPPERDTTRINERIRVPEVRLIDERGQPDRRHEDRRGARATPRSATSTSSRSRPRRARPSCRVLDYSKYKYEQAQKQKQARKHQQQITVREIKFRPKIAAARLRHQEGPRRALPAPQGQGQGHDHVPRARGDAPRARQRRSSTAWPRSSPSSRVVEQRPQPGRAQHDDDARPLEGRARRHASARRADESAAAPTRRRRGERRAEGAAPRTADRQRRRRQSPRGAPDAEPSDARPSEPRAEHRAVAAGDARAGVALPDPARHAEDEDPLRRQEALQGDRHRQGAGRHAFTSHILEKKSPKRKRAPRPARRSSPTHDASA